MFLRTFAYLTHVLLHEIEDVLWTAITSSQIFYQATKAKTNLDSTMGYITLWGYIVKDLVRKETNEFSETERSQKCLLRDLFLLS